MKKIILITITGEKFPAKDCARGLRFSCEKHSNEDLSCDDICMQTALLVRFQSRNFSDQSLSMTSECTKIFVLSAKIR